MDQRRVLLAARRARLRKESGGAVMFIVAVTLAMLAAMGVYGLSSARNDVRTAGHYRQATQSQHIAEMAGMAVAEGFTPDTATELYNKMRDPNDRSNLVGAGKRKCKSANPPSNNVSLRDSEACRIYGEPDLVVLANANQNKYASTGTPWASCAAAGADTCPLFDKNSFQVYGTAKGAQFWRPDLTIEVTMPVDAPPQPGYSLSNNRAQNVTATITVYVELREDDESAATWRTNRPESVAVARGRMTFGPVNRN